MKICSWNVNGLRALMRKGFADFVAHHRPDILCLQEVKAFPEQLEESLPEGYHAYWNSAEKKGYSGTLTLARTEPSDVRLGIGRKGFDREGRVITCRFPDFFLVNVYTPNAQNELRRLDYRVNEWDRAFLRHVRRLEKEAPVVFCGDLNVAHQEIDLARPADNRLNPGFTDEERASFDRYVKAGFVDTFRTLHPEPGQYTWWSYRAGARSRNIGWRIDYVMISSSLRPRLRDAFILPEVMGSDHCPVGVDLAGPAPGGSGRT